MLTQIKNSTFVSVLNECYMKKIKNVKNTDTHPDNKHPDIKVVPTPLHKAKAPVRRDVTSVSFQLSCGICSSPLACFI